MSDSESTRQRGEFRISEMRDSITRVNDHKVIFVDTQDNPIDQGALEMMEIGKLPHYEYLMLGRARLNLMKSKLKSKEYYDKRINPQNIKIRDLVHLLKEPGKGKFLINLRDRIKF
jgi:hypothetical protein